MILHHLIALTIAVILDSIIGDPPNLPHPVKWMGSLIIKLDNLLNKGTFKKQKGIIMLFVVLVVVWGISYFIITISYSFHLVAGIMVESLFITTAIAQKSLKISSLEVYKPMACGDVENARKKLSYIVGRDTDQLQESEIVRGTIETIAENTSDGITAPLFWALLGGAPLAMVYRAINTCDSMVGYKNQKYAEFGWASAKLDDVVNFIPSRMTALAMMLSSKPVTGTRRKAWRIVLRDAKKHPSPNSGWGEAAVASLLGIRLGGTNYYKGIKSDRATMGDPTFIMEKGHILKANGIVSRTVPIFVIILWLGGLLIELAATWS
ncbi:adenosylcobinamide-phosphate synthase CbiB [Bacillus massilinigeriensis]|uniref:adenosylcobinamide-phosphate synthase CbiB n=1 Tax=Bacillus mediterraneensis TaxID=1805474 RepID=UPI0008F88A22|nr:adenosylcobinamide-phosphate synthase CbiB [Bacillus mediterraneensis]